MTITRDYLAEWYEELLLLEPPYFDEAILGVAERAGGFTALAYDRSRCIDLIMMHGGLTREDAEEYFEFNTLGAYVGEHTPVFIDTRVAE